jgi:LuxR family transcriptional regulator (chaperone HchA-associated)
MTSVIDTLYAIERCDNVKAIMERVREIARSIGYNRILMFAFSAARDELVGGVYWSEGHWFDVDGQMDAETFVRHCPVTRHVLETDEPYYWTREETPQGRRYRFGAPSQRAGLHGLQVPVFGHNGLAGAVCFGGEKIDSSARSRLTLTQIGVAAFLAARKLIETTQQEGNTTLSARELEVLQWIASGNRIAQVANSLGLSERTVENHLRHIRQRLQVKTTAQAVGTALRSGSLQSFKKVEVHHHDNTAGS